MEANDISIRPIKLCDIFSDGETGSYGLLTDSTPVGLQ